MHRSSRLSFLLALATCLVPLDADAAGGAQLDPLVLRGVLQVGGVPADTGTVVLHRVTPEDAGPIDSVRVRGEGVFELPLPDPPGVGGALYFATYRHEEVLFFGEPITQIEQLEEPYTVKAWPRRVWSPGSGSFRLAFRNIFIEDGPEGWRVVDVFEVGHDDPFTWEAPEGQPVWSYPLPASAMNLQKAEMDLDPEAIRFEDGGLAVYAPFPPGDRLFVVRYDLPSLETTFPMPGRVEVVELLIREPAPPLRIDGLQADAPVELERGSLYRRWWGEDVLNIAPRIQLGEEEPFSAAWLAIGLALVLVIVASAAVLRRPTKAGAVRPRTRRVILMEIAGLDEAVQSGALSSEVAEARRASLLAEVERIDAGRAASM
jgi:hypothetical protein